MQRRATLRFPLTATALTGAALLAACSGSAPNQAVEPLVATVLAAPDDGRSGEAYTGTIHARIESTLAFRVPGKIVA
ncbi:MAG: hypothetical protein WCL10_12685, partial [Novosphingobium sp.]|uniref:hypothetical protein n=1 Tax=Novosphingobium sp. TaxID=1874826 RepID=UPI003017EBBC